MTVDGAVELIERHYGVVYNVAYRTMGRREDAEDITQQTFARALPRLADLRDPEAAGGWLCRIAANLCLDELRRRQLAQEHVEPDLDALPDADPNASPARVAERREVRAAVWSAALSLPHQQRLVLALREWQDLTYKQIAEALDISVPTVESILVHARQGFRRAYQAGAEPWPANETCKWIVGRLSASIDDELRVGERARIDAHLPACSTCQFAARELRATKLLYGLMPLATAPAGAQLAALMAAPAVGVAPVVVAGLSGASGGGVLVSLGVAKVGVGSAAAMVGSAMMLLMGSDGIGAFGSAEAVLAASAPVARMAVAAPTASTQPIAEIAVVAARNMSVGDSPPSDPPRPEAELAKVEPLRIMPYVTLTPVPTGVPDGADQRGASPVAQAESQVLTTPLGRETTGVSGQTTAGRSSGTAGTAAVPVRAISTPPPAEVDTPAQSPAIADPADDEVATPVRGAPDQEEPDNRSRGADPHSSADGGDDPTPGNSNGNANGNGNGNGVNPQGNAVGQHASAWSLAQDPPGQVLRQDPPGPAASKASPGGQAGTPPGQTASTTAVGQPKALPSAPTAATAPPVTPANAASGGKPQSPNPVAPPNSSSAARPQPLAKPESAAKPLSPTKPAAAADKITAPAQAAAPAAGASPAQAGGGAKPPGPPGK